MSGQLLSPSPSPPPPVPTPTIPAQINAATQKQHVVLNRLIIDRLSLALPPKAGTPALLGHGIAAFAHIFYTFEAAWEELDETDEKDGSQLHQWLATLRPNGLPRSSRLKQDLDFIAHRTGVRRLPSTPGQRAMLKRMRAEILAKPHILIAYGWVMYMAVFSGGRWIRQQFSNAGVGFWTGKLDTMGLEKEDIALLEISGFSFLSFDGEEDGMDIKALFKARLVEAEALLTQQERQDVIDAGQQLFGDCITLVGMLDRAVLRQRLWEKLPAILLCLAAILFIVFLYSSECLH